MLIVPFAINYLAQALRIEALTESHPWDEANFRTCFGKRHCNFLSVCEQTGRVLGFIITQLVLDSVEIFKISVDPAYQRQGIGSQLMNAILKGLKPAHCLQVWLEVRSSNQTAIVFYESLGFHEVTIRRGYYRAKNGYEDAVVMGTVREKQHYADRYAVLP